MQRSSTARRQTLGPVSINQGTSQSNRRQSLGPISARGPSKSSKPPRGRSSMIPRVGRENLIPPTPPSSTTRKPMSTSRRNSMGGDRRQSLVPPSVPTKADPRPVADKNYQQGCVKKLLNFLVEKGYDHPISHKALARPSGKDFNHIMTFLLRLVDPNFQDGTMKIEDEIAMSFRAMGYPFPVSKTSLVAAGSPHTWPALLAALTWLMERIQCLSYTPPTEDDSANFDSLEELESKTDKVFFKYLSTSYTAFLEGDERMTEDLEVGLAEHFEKDDEIIEKEIEQMTDKNAVILEQINSLVQGEQDLEDYIKKRDGYKTDLEQFHDLIHQMNNHVDTLSHKKQERVQDLKEADQKLERSNVHIKELETSVSNQVLSLDDVRKIQSEAKGIGEAINRLDLLKSERRVLLGDDESEIEDLWSRIESSVSIFNRKLHDLNIPGQTKIAATSITTVNNASQSDKISLGVDLSTIVQPCLLESKREYIEGLLQAKARYQWQLDRLGKSEQAFTESLERLKIIEEKIDSCEEALAIGKVAHEAKLGIRLREAELMEGNNGSIRDPIALEEQMAQFEYQCAELERLRATCREDNELLKRNICLEIEEACSAMTEYDLLCASSVSELTQYCKDRRSNVGNFASTSRSG